MSGYPLPAAPKPAFGRSPHETIAPRFGGDYFITSGFDKRYGLAGANANMYHSSSFFRDPQLLTLLVEQYIPQKFPDGVTFESWGCSTGQEPYTLAMLLMDRLQLAPEEASALYPIEASDIDPHAVAMAKLGMYGFTNHDEDLDRMQKLGLRPEEYFDDLDAGEYNPKYALFEQGDYKKPGGTVTASLKAPTRMVQVAPDIRAMIDFSVQDFTENLTPANAGDPPRMVFLRNVLGHYNPHERIVLAKKLFDALPSGSTLVIGNFDYKRGVHAALNHVGFNIASRARDHKTQVNDPARMIFERP